MNDFGLRLAPPEGSRNLLLSPKAAAPSDQTARALQAGALPSRTEEQTEVRRCHAQHRCKSGENQSFQTTNVNRARSLTAARDAEEARPALLRRRSISAAQLLKGKNIYKTTI